MELGMVHGGGTLSREEYAKLHAENACFYCRKPNAGHVARDCPMKKEACGKRDESLGITVVPSEATKSRRGTKICSSAGIWTSWTTVNRGCCRRKEEKETCGFR